MGWGFPGIVSTPLFCFRYVTASDAHWEQLFCKANDIDKLS